ncbi:hypothetical protein GX50_08794, partial [[Emmonsia] crescens]
STSASMHSIKRLNDTSLYQSLYENSLDDTDENLLNVSFNYGNFKQTKKLK